MTTKLLCGTFAVCLKTMFESRLWTRGMLILFYLAQLLCASAHAVVLQSCQEISRSFFGFLFCVTPE